MKKFLKIGLMLGILFYMPMKNIWAQCPNLDFSYGNLTHWQGYILNSCDSSFIISPPLPIPRKLEVLNRTWLEQQGLLYDEHCPFIPKIPDGCNFSCRIGNDEAGKQTHVKVCAIEYEMRVNSRNSLLLLSFAWVETQQQLILD